MRSVANIAEIGTVSSRRMCCNEGCREEFASSNLGLDYHNPRRFVIFECGWPRLYMLWRGVMAAYHFAMLALAANSGRKGYIKDPSENVKFFIFETHWMYLTLSFCNILDFISVVYTHCARQDILKGETSTMPRYLRVVWVWQNLASNVNLKVSIMYWAHMYAPPYPAPTIDMVTHLGNIVYVLLNLLVSGSPVRFYHFLFSFLWVCIYIVYTLFYYVFGGTSGMGARAIYPYWDWEQSPGTAALYSCLGGLLIVVGVQMVMLFVFMVRVRIWGCCCGAQGERGERIKLVEGNR